MANVNDLRNITLASEQNQARAGTAADRKAFFLNNSPESINAAKANLPTDANFGQLKQEVEKNKSKKLTYDELIERQKAMDLKYGPGRSVASKEEWLAAWKEKERDHHKRNPPRESHTDPSPLLLDKISSLPPDSPERRNAEMLKLTLHGNYSATEYGLDNLNRESYKDLQRLTKHSEMLNEGAKAPLPTSQQMFGSEEGKMASNLSDWRAPVANASRPVSDAMGSHADISSSIVKNPMGPDQSLPTACAHQIDQVSPAMTNQTDIAFKAAHVDNLQNIPSKSMGSLRQLTTAADSVLSVPFEILSDVYNGLLKVMDSIANLIDGVMANITKFSISAVGGLVDGLFPAGMLKGLIGSVSKFASQIPGLGQLLGGFSAVSGISNVIGGIASGLSSALSAPLKLANMLLPGAHIGDLLGGMAGTALGCAAELFGAKRVQNILNIASIASSASQLLGGLGGMGGNLLGNLGATIMGGIKGAVGAVTNMLRHPEQILMGLLPPEIANALALLSKMCGFGATGNAGYSAGFSMDYLRDNAYSTSMSTHAAYASILGPLFNKDVKPVGSYSRQINLDQFEDSKFVQGAQGNKGVTMLGPGATSNQKIFGASAYSDGDNTPSRSGMTDEQIDKQIQEDDKTEKQLREKLGPEQYRSYKQQQIAALDADAAMWRQRAAEARYKAANPTSYFDQK